MNPFQFYSKLDLTILLGIKARNVVELLDGIQKIPDASVYFHTHKFLQQHHYLSHEPSNDFAYWTGKILNRVALAEQLSSLDIVQFHRIADLRIRLVEIIESHVNKAEVELNNCPPGNEFHFMASKIFSFPTPHLANNLTEMKDHLETISITSLYYHIYDAKLRLAHDENDFSIWFREIGKPELANAVQHLDPYTYTLEGLRKRLLVLVRNYDTN